MLNQSNVHNSRRILIICVVLTLVTFAVYWQVNRFDFINVDDDFYITKNHYVRSGITPEGIRWAFASTDAQFWFPLTWLSWMLDYQLYGLNAGGYHLTNVILHMLSALLLFALLHRMTGAVWQSAFVTAFFTLHPLRVESVAFIAQRKDVLSAFFWMLTLYLYILYTEKPVLRRYLMVLLSFICGLMSKPMIVTLPVVMILLDYWPLSRFHIGIESKKDSFWLWQFREKIVFLILSAFFSVCTLHTQYKPFGTSLRQLQQYIFPLNLRISNALVSFAAYLGKTFWPDGLTAFNVFPDKPAFWQLSGAVLLIISISIAVTVMRKHRPYLMMGWLWYLITLLPVIGIIPVMNVGARSMADRYTYLPSIGIGIMLAWGLPRLLPREKMRKKVLFPAGIFILFVLAVLTWKQCGYWGNSIDLINHTLQTTKDNYLAYVIRGNAYYDLGQYPQALQDYNTAIHLKPDFVEAYNNRGFTYDKLGWYHQAIADYNEAIRLRKDFAYTYYNRGVVYAKLGLYSQAMGDFNEALRLKPDFVEVYNYRGIVYYQSEKYLQAVENFSEAIRLKPGYGPFYNNRGASYFYQRNTGPGCSDAQKACALGDCRLMEQARKEDLCR